MCERNSGDDRRAVDLSRSTLGQALPPREIPHKPMSWQRGMIPCSKLVGISVTPYKTAAKLNPEITVASRTRRTSESLTGGSHRSLPTPNRTLPVPDPARQPRRHSPAHRPHPAPHPARQTDDLNLGQPGSPPSCFNYSHSLLSSILTQAKEPLPHPGRRLYEVQARGPTPERRPDSCSSRSQGSPRLHQLQAKGPLVWIS